MKAKLVKASKTKKTAPKPAVSAASDQSREMCFVISPFGGFFDGYYRNVFVRAIERAGFSAHRGDDLYRPSSIIQDIWDYVRNSKVLLADLTGKNPNVLYELGLAHAVGKPVIMITQSKDDIPFDLRSLRYITYDLRNPLWSRDLIGHISQALKEVQEAPEKAVPPTFLKIDNEKESPTVSFLEKQMLELSQQIHNIRRNQGAFGAEPELMGPDEARKYLRKYLDMGMTDAMILGHSDGKGIPHTWAQAELAKMRKP